MSLVRVSEVKDWLCPTQCANDPTLTSGWNWIPHADSLIRKAAFGQSAVAASRTAPSGRVLSTSLSIIVMANDQADGRSWASLRASSAASLLFLDPEELIFDSGISQPLDAKTLGYSSWAAFAEDVKRETSITDVNGAFAFVGKHASTVPQVFRALIRVLGDGKKWVSMGQVAQQVDCKGSGYKKFKDLALDAEKRGYVATMHSGPNWSLKKA